MSAAHSHTSMYLHAGLVPSPVFWQHVSQSLGFLYDATPQTPLETAFHVDMLFRMGLACNWTNASAETPSLSRSLFLLFDKTLRIQRQEYCLRSGRLADKGG